MKQLGFKPRVKERGSYEWIQCAVLIYVISTKGIDGLHHYCILSHVHLCT